MLRRLLVSRYWGRAFEQGGVSTWAQEIAVREELNRRVTGSVGVWPLEWFAAERGARPFPRALSLGCGEGALERDLMAKGVCETLVGIDLSARALELARRKAEEAGYTAIRYEKADLDRLELDPRSWEAVFVHQALHHVRELESCLSQVAEALTDGGIFYVDEYVGPSRHEWNRELIGKADEVYRALPKAVRRRSRLQLPVDWRDPSEAIRSSAIVPLLERYFEIRERRDYGGNLLSVIYPHLRLEHLAGQARQDLVERLLERESELLAQGEASYYTVIVAAKRGPSPSPGVGAYRPT